MQPQEIEWLKAQSYIRTSFCKNLHAKCYLNESDAIVTSLNLYEFSQINNNEMGILIRREDDAELYKDTYEEAQRIIRISDEVRISMERVSTTDDGPAARLRRRHRRRGPPQRQRPTKTLHLPHRPKARHENRRMAGQGGGGAIADRRQRTPLPHTGRQTGGG
nr:hypothetical protein [Comamonas jiangduensis]